MKKILTLFLFNGTLLYSAAQTNVYSALTIPDSLKKDADVVVRDEYIKVSIKDKNTGSYDVRQVLTVLNEQGKNYLYFQQYSDRFRVLDDAEINVYDVLGNKKKSYTKKEMTTGKYSDELVPDAKITYFNVAAPSYPITIEFTYRIKYKGILNLPDYEMQHSWQSIQHSVFEVEVPSDPGIRYKLLNTDKKPAIINNGNKNVYRWEQANIPAFKSEKSSGATDKYLPQVLVAPNKFQLDEYDGDMTSWKNFGLWLNDLYAKVSDLSEDRKQFYRNMVKNAKTDREKAAILYNYMQSNMRYVSISLGIGGFRPFPSSFVDEKKYGDCKALSNYMKSTLDAVGIRSNIVIIYRDYEPRFVDEKFPMNDFNHAILCIPNTSDTIWLECTSTILPFASLDESTLDRKAVMVTENGGVVVHTPASNYKINTGSVYTIIDVKEDGSANVKSMHTFFGEERDILLSYFHDLKEDDKRRYIISGLKWKHPDASTIADSKNKDNPYIIDLTMDYDKVYSFSAGSKLFFESRLYPLFYADITENNNRKRDYYFPFPYQVFDTTVYQFPTGYAMDNLPKNKSITKPFAQYTCTYSWDAISHTLTTIASLQVKERVIKAADYTALYDFKKQVTAEMNEKIVMKKE